MNPRLVPQSRRLFLSSAGVILLLTAAAKLASALGTAQILRTPDPLLLLPYRWVLLGVAALELAVVGLLMLSSTPKVKLLSLLWLSTNFLLYRSAKWFFNLPEPCHCLGVVGANLPLTPHTQELLLRGVVFYLVGGSLAFLLPGQRSGGYSRWPAARPPVPAEANSVGAGKPSSKSGLDLSPGVSEGL